MNITEHFKTPIWDESKPEFLSSLDKASDKYIKQAKDRNKKHIKKFGDFGLSHHSTPLLQDNDFKDFKDYVGQKSWEYLDHQGFDMQHYTAMFSEMWVQEFSKKGGGHPRTGARATKLKIKSDNTMFNGTELIHFIPKPGGLLIFPGYLEHEFAVDFGKEPLRFIHWNIQAVPKEMTKVGI